MEFALWLIQPKRRKPTVIHRTWNDSVFGTASRCTFSPANKICSGRSDVGGTPPKSRKLQTVRVDRLWVADIHWPFTPETTHHLQHTQAR